MEWKTLNTIRIYETDSHARRLQARVLSCEEGENGWLVELDRTIFYPTGGGQPCDMGTLGGADVTETLLRGETVLHRCTAALPVGADVTGEIDWARRLDLMQQHSGEHLVSGLIHARFGYENVGFHLGADLVTIDFNGEVDEQALQELERAANEAVWADFAPHIWYPEPDELAHLPYRSKKALTGAVRLVQFGDIDLCACCGTHVAHTGEIGLIKLFSTTHFRGGSRIEMACGGRALAVLNALCAQNRDISVRLSAKPVQTAAAVARLASERTEAQQRAAALEDRLFALLAQDGQTLRFEPPMPIEQVAELAKPFLSIGNQYGEGWFLTGEMAELVLSGTPNIVCIQPFACLPNHVVGKGVIKALKKAYPQSNIVAVDYDPGASEVNQLNRIKLMLSTAKKRLAEEEAAAV